jgi:hypothetical protein
VSIETIRIEYIIGFIFGVLGIALGIFLICFQFVKEGYIINSSSDPYGIFAGWATFGVVSLAAGAMVIHYTYQIFIPLKKNNFTYAKACPHCAAIIAENATICEKCKQSIAND